MLKVLERTNDSLLVRIPALYEREIRNLLKRYTTKNSHTTSFISKTIAKPFVTKKIRIIEDDATPDEIKAIDQFYKSRLGKVGFSDLRSAREVIKEIRSNRK